MAPPQAFGNMWIVIPDFGALLFEQIHDLEGLRFPKIIHVFFIGQPLYQDLGAVQRLVMYKWQPKIDPPLS